MASKESKVQVSMNVVTIAGAQRQIMLAWAAGKVPFLWGPPGVGKSDLIFQIGKLLSRPVIDMRLLLLDQTDLKGIPYYDPETNTVRWAPPGELPKKGDVSMENAILFLDEMNAANPSVQAAAYQLILNKRIGEYVLPKGVNIVAAGNRLSDRGVAFQMPTPLANRFAPHLEIKSDTNEWLVWAINNNVNPQVVGYIDQHKGSLFNFDPKSGEHAFATNRSWTALASMMDEAATLGFSVAELGISAAGTVGQGLAIDFTAHLEYGAKLPKPEAILEGRADKPGTDNISAVYSLVYSVLYELRTRRIAAGNKDTALINVWHQEFDNFLKYMMDNFTPEMMIMALKTAFTQMGMRIDVNKMPNYATFVTKFGKYFSKAV
jgi:hypothetical protein